MRNYFILLYLLSHPGSQIHYSVDHRDQKSKNREAMACPLIRLYSKPLSSFEEWPRAPLCSDYNLRFYIVLLCISHELLAPHFEHLYRLLGFGHNVFSVK